MTDITWNNRGSVSVSTQTQLETLAAFAVDYLNSLLARPIDYDIVMTIDDAYPRFSGSADIVRVGDGSRSDLWEGVGIHQARTGVETAGYDAKMFINQAYLDDLFLDATPQTADDLPAGRVDGFSVLLHEMLHGLGFIGWTDWADYGNDAGAVSPFDLHIKLYDGLPYFTGVNAMAVYGGPVPLTAGNVFHLGNGDGAGTDLVPDLMNGVVFHYSTRYDVSELDLAFLADFGIGTIRADILAATAGADDIAAGAGNDTIIALGYGADRFDGGSGSDMVVYAGTRDGYDPDLQANGTLRVDKAAGTDTLLSIERIRFDDGDLVFDITGDTAAAAYRLYGGAFDRTPDEGGLRFWIDSWLDAGRSLHDAAAQFIASTEFTSLYGPSLSDGQFIDQLYLNVLDRPGEDDGRSYWQSFLGNQTGDRADVLVNFTQLPEYVGNSAADIANGFWVIQPDAFA